MGIRLRLPGLVDHVPDTWNDRQLADAGQLMDGAAEGGIQEFQGGAFNAIALCTHKLSAPRN